VRLAKERLGHDLDQVRAFFVWHVQQDDAVVLQAVPGQQALANLQ
jgi:hypothetical protein